MLNWVGFLTASIDRDALRRGRFLCVNMRTVEWDYDRNVLRMIDQRILPAEFKVLSYDDYHKVAEAIRQMVVRGAPAIGATAAFGLALAAQQSRAANPNELRSDLKQAAEVLHESRPTAVNLGWALKRMLQVAVDCDGDADELRATMLEEAQRVADEDVAINQRMARNGAVLINDGDTLIHHCNTGALATVDWGTALGVIRMAHEQGKNIHVLVDETRPRLQGARLTAWELKQYGIPYEIISDNAAGYFLRSGQVQKVFFGGDRMAANGDVANKIGTYMLALAAKDNHVPAYSVVPTSTIDLSLAHGGLIPIEERNPDEVLNLQVNGQPVAPEGAAARNPAFDVTPHRLLSAIITENGVVYPPYDENLAKVVHGRS
jgi:methylthioribose-1-phosphate isomerase